jgi:parallel beta-helix repeat protein
MSRSVAPDRIRARFESLESRTLLSTYYVSASSGADTNAGTSDAAAFKTLQKAANAVRAGDTVVVRAGTYASGMNLFGHAGGTAAAPIRFLADPGATITRSATAGTNATMAAINVESTGGWFVIDGFTITDANQTTERAGVRLASSPHCVVSNNTIDGPYDGIFVSRSDDTLLEHNVCRDAYGEHGIYVNGSADYVIRGNECYGNPWNGIHTNVSDGVNQINSGGIIEANLVHDNDLAGMDLTGISDAVIRNNLVYGNGRHAVVMQNSNQGATVACHDVTFVNNTFDARAGSSAWAIQMSAATAQPAGSTWSGNDNNVTVFNNVLMANAGSGNGSIGDLAGSIPPTLRSDYNVVVDGFRSSGAQRTLAAWRTGTGNDANSVIGTASGLFVNPAAGDYHLKAGAPGIDRGAASFNEKTAPATDYEDEIRPQGGGYDPGVDEFRAGSGTPDTTAPTIASVASTNVASTSVTITWTTDEPADTQVEYGTTTDYGSSTNLNATRAATHAQILTGLSPSTTYHYRVKSRDAAGNLATSSDFTFTTAIADTAAPVISSVASSAVTATGARIAWTTDEASTTQVEYGTTTSYGSNTSLASNLATVHSQSLGGLSAETLYHYRVKSRDAAGNLASSPDFTFTTAPVPVPPPQVFSPVPYYGDFANYTGLTASRWSVVDDGGDERLFLNTTNYSELDDSRLGEMARPNGRSFGDFDLEVTARTGDDLSANTMADYAIVFGYVDANDYTYLMMNATTGFTSFRAVVNGVQTVIGTATAPGIPDAAYHDVLVSRRGTTLTASVDGVRILSATNAKLGLAGGVGLGSFNDSAYFDDFNVVAPSADIKGPVVADVNAPEVAEAGSAAYTFTVTFSDDRAVDIASLDGSDLLVTAPGGASLPVEFLSVAPATLGSPRTATYSVQPPDGAWDLADNGTYAVTLQPSQVKDTSGNFASAGAIGSFDVAVPSEVVGRYVFYNASPADGRTAQASALDDNAIDPNKQALLPGAGPATAANYTNYSGGINGIIIDVEGLPAGTDPTADSFALSIGRGGGAEGWTAAPLPSSVTVRRGAGTGGSDRVTLVWPSGAIKNTWLRVSVLATTATGLAKPDVFYFGNLIGETGDAAAGSRPFVTARDLLAVRRAMLSPIAPAGAALEQLDFNRDGVVDVRDFGLARSSLFASLPMISAPADGAPA